MTKDRRSKCRGRARPCCEALGRHCGMTPTRNNARIACGENTAPKWRCSLSSLGTLVPIIIWAIGARFIRKGVNVRILIVALAVAASIIGPAFAQTQPTRPSAYATVPTMPSAFATSAINPCRSSFNPTSPCYTGTMYPSYSAITPSESPDRTNRQALPGADSLNDDQAKLRIEAKGYSNVSGLQKDNRGIWRGKATMKDGATVAVILDMEGNIYSEWYPSISIRPLNSLKEPARQH